MLVTTVCWSAAAILVGLLLASRILRLFTSSTGPHETGTRPKSRRHRSAADEELEGVGESFRAISEKLAARSRGRLMSGVTHEVRNP